MADPLLATLERYYDTVPRSVATTEEVGPFTNFRPGEVPTWSFYARPRLEYDGPVTADDVRRVLERRAELGLPRNLEWVHEVTPALLPAVTEAVGDRTHRYPLLVRRSVPAPDQPAGVAVLAPDHPDIAAAVGAIAAAFAGTDDDEPAVVTAQPRLIEAGELILVAAYDGSGTVVGGGSAAPRGDVTELMGIGVLPRARNAGLGTAITQALVRAAMESGVRTLFLSAGSDAAAAIYRRVGFVDVGMACILELDDEPGPADHPGPRHLVVMGVSGTGKTSVGGRLADALGAEFLEGDDHHPEANKEKMAAGTPLTDDDRRPWLRSLAQLLRSRDQEGVATVLTCSALRRAYRDVLRSGVPAPRLVFVHLQAPVDVLEERMGRRQGHFMPPSLLRSQLETLEPLGVDEAGIVVDVSAELDDVVAAALTALGGSKDVRRVGPDDWVPWSGIRLRSLQESPDAFGSTYEREAAYDETDWRERMVSGPRVLVYDDGRPVAIGGGFPYDGALMVFGMWTDPAHRRRGHARAILDVVVAWARERDLPVVLHVNLANPAARAAYEHYGFVATGEVEPLRPGSDQTMERMRLP